MKEVKELLDGLNSRTRNGVHGISVNPGMGVISNIRLAAQRDGSTLRILELYTSSFHNKEEVFKLAKDAIKNTENCVFLIEGNNELVDQFFEEEASNLVTNNNSIVVAVNYNNLH